MTTPYKFLLLSFSAVTVFVILSSFFVRSRPGSAAFPYEKAGLTERQAAAHLLSRFTYGPSADGVDEAIKAGLEQWFEQQLQADLPDEGLNSQLGKYESLTMSNAQIVQEYQRYGDILRMAVREGVIDKDSIDKTDKKAYREKLYAYAKEKGVKPHQQLIKEFGSQKILRALYSQNQLQEVMTEFWFNHFNVSFSKVACAPFIPAFERDVIRPNALNNFETLLMATAKSPAMLLYLDNARSTGAMTSKDSLTKKGEPKRVKGLNENYAREVMELHTLGVDGGYTQKDVTEAARVLTGWTVFPMGDSPYSKDVKKQIAKYGEEKLKARGFVREGDFLFAPGRHDKDEKTVLGKTFAPGGGYEEGIELLRMLANHQSTASFISKKLAVRFVNDNPSQNLVERMSKTFLEKNGDIKHVLRTLVYSPEFWAADAVREKTKSPFELMMSALRSLNASVTEPSQLFNWLDRMGHKMYHYQAPTGFPDKGQYWISTGSLLNRMNFGLALASGKIPGIHFDLPKLNNDHEPESAEDALQTYCKLLLPERNTSETIIRLTPLLNDPALPEKVDKAADQTVELNMAGNEAETGNEEREENTIDKRKNSKMTSDRYQLSQVVGIIIGSPEFQRR